MNEDTGAKPVSPTSPAHAPSEATGWERATLEKLVFATIRERQAERRWRLFMRLSWLLIFGLLAWWLYSMNTASSSVASPHTAVIEIRGAISSDTEASAANIVSSLNSAFQDPGARAIVLLIDSPGGSPVQAGIINDEITRLKALHNKPIYAVVEETCASAAYYIAAATDDIYVDKASLVGSIGVLMDGFGFTGLMEKIGVERRLLTAGDNKGMLDPFSPQDPEQRAYIQGMLGQIHAQFIEVVKKGRGERLKETPETFSGLVWSGQQAVSLGLADGLGNLDFVAREIAKADNIVDYTQRENLGLRLAKRFGASVGQGIFMAARSAGLQLK